MADAEREELRQYLRDEVLPRLTAVMIRGGPDTLSLILSHARRTHRLYCLDGDPLWGVSAFGALDGSGPASSEGLLAGRLGTYEQVHMVTIEALIHAGFGLLASFRRPHFTIRLADDSDDQTARLLDALGPANENPYNRVVRQRRGETHP